MRYSFWMVLLLAGVFSVESEARLSFTTPKQPQPKMIQTVSYLSNTNTALQQALDAHNLLNQIPDLLNFRETADELAQEESLLDEQVKFMDSCYAKKYGKVFKNPQQAWANIANAYEAKRQVLPSDTDQKSANQSKEQLSQEKNAGWHLNREVLADVYKNPKKYGELNTSGSFPLWKDQITLYNRQWDQFYEKMNAQFGEDLKGRPVVSDEVRYDITKYDQVVKAHKSYLANLQKIKPQSFTELPPKAPEALPDINNLLYIDQGKIYPEIPKIWQSEENQQILAKSEGEFSKFFENGDISRPTQMAAQTDRGDLENIYEMRIALDAMQKGSHSIKDNLNQMEQNWLQKVANVGVVVPQGGLSGQEQFGQLRQLLQDKKKEAIKEAYAYVAQLEEQDKNHPELIAQRLQIQQERRNRLSKQAKAALVDLDQEMLSISQMSPVAQQKLILAALEKDTQALVYLTETNALNLDQMIRERRAANKIISEAQDKMKTVLKEQTDQKPVLQQCPF